MSAFAIEAADTEKLAEELFNKHAAGRSELSDLTWNDLSEWKRNSWRYTARRRLHEITKQTLRAQRLELRKRRR